MQANTRSVMGSSTECGSLLTYAGHEIMFWVRAVMFKFTGIHARLETSIHRYTLRLSVALVIKYTGAIIVDEFQSGVFERSATSQTITSWLRGHLMLRYMNECFTRQNFVWPRKKRSQVLLSRPYNK